MATTTTRKTQDLYIGKKLHASNFDELMDHVDLDGKFQRRFNLLYNLVYVVLVAMPYMNLVLVLAVPDHWSITTRITCHSLPGVSLPEPRITLCQEYHYHNLVSLFARSITTRITCHSLPGVSLPEPRITLCQEYHYQNHVSLFARSITTRITYHSLPGVSLPESRITLCQEYHYQNLVSLFARSITARITYHSLTGVSPPESRITLYQEYHHQNHVSLSARSITTRITYHSLPGVSLPESRITLCQEYHYQNHVSLFARSITARITYHSLPGVSLPESRIPLCQEYHCQNHVSLFARSITARITYHSLPGVSLPESRITLCQEYHCQNHVSLFSRSITTRITYHSLPGVSPPESRIILCQEYHHQNHVSLFARSITTRITYHSLPGVSPPESRITLCQEYHYQNHVSLFARSITERITYHSLPGVSLPEPRITLCQEYHHQNLVSLFARSITTRDHVSLFARSITARITYHSLQGVSLPESRITLCQEYHYQNHQSLSARSITARISYHSLPGVSLPESRITLLSITARISYHSLPGVSLPEPRITLCQEYHYQGPELKDETRSNRKTNISFKKHILGQLGSYFSAHEAVCSLLALQRMRSQMHMRTDWRRLVLRVDWFSRVEHLSQSGQRCRHGWEYDRTWYATTATSQENWVCDRQLNVAHSFVFSRVGDMVGTFVFGNLGDVSSAGLLPVDLDNRCRKMYVDLHLVELPSVPGDRRVRHQHSFRGLHSPGHSRHGDLVEQEEGPHRHDAVRRSDPGCLPCPPDRVGDERLGHLPPLDHLTVRDLLLDPQVSTYTHRPSFRQPEARFSVVRSFQKPNINVADSLLGRVRMFIESPRWLSAKGRNKESAKVICYIGRVNGKPMQEHLVEDNLNMFTEKREKTYGVASLASSWRLARNTALIIICCGSTIGPSHIGTLCPSQFGVELETCQEHGADHHLLSGVDPTSGSTIDPSHIGTLCLSEFGVELETGQEHGANHHLLVVSSWRLARNTALIIICCLASSWRLARNTALIVICWSISSLTVFTLMLNVVNMSGNPFLNYVWQSASELPGYFVGRWISDRFGRRWPPAISFAIATAGFLLMAATTRGISDCLSNLSVAFFTIWPIKRPKRVLVGLDYNVTCFGEGGNGWSLADHVAQLLAAWRGADTLSVGLLCLARAEVAGQWVTFITLAVTKMCITVPYYVVFLQAMETYPTSVRQTGTSLGSLASSGIGMLGPYIVYLGSSVDTRYPYIILGLLTTLAAISATFLPETLNQKLPENLTDAQNFGKDQKFWSLTPVPSSASIAKQSYALVPKDGDTGRHDGNTSDVDVLRGRLAYPVIYPHLRGKIVGKPFRNKTTLGRPDQDSNHDLAVVISRPVKNESDALDHSATEAGIYSNPVASLVLTDSSQLTSDSQHLGIYSSPVASLVLTDSSQLTSDSQHLGIYSSPVASLVLTDSSQLTSDSQHLGIYSSPVASLVLTDSSQLTSDSQHLGIYSSPVASLVLTDSSQLTSDSQHLGIYSSPVASLVLTDSSQLTSDSQHLGIYSSPVASLVLTDSSQLTSDSQHLVVIADPFSGLRAAIRWIGGRTIFPTAPAQHHTLVTKCPPVHEQFPPLESREYSFPQLSSGLPGDLHHILPGRPIIQFVFVTLIGLIKPHRYVSSGSSVTSLSTVMSLSLSVLS
uniref:Uncharacterized protein n=1 Tax=Timema douglasi TaxID=61478 RepID=A0A7R8ZD40_TIMDO|nr:unnamed protein product [Timema douglasi]